jgi:hypothetical protein
MSREGDLGLVVDLDSLTNNLVRPTCVVSQTANGVSNVEVSNAERSALRDPSKSALGNTPGESDRFPVVQTLDLGQLLRITLNEIREFVEELRSYKPGNIFAPSGIESLAGGGDSCVDVFRRS